MTAVSVIQVPPTGIGVTRAGPAGKGWVFGVGAPASDVGRIGEMYLDTDPAGVFNAYGPKLGATWAGAQVYPLGAQSGAAIAAAEAAQSSAEAAAEDRQQTAEDRQAAEQAASIAASYDPSQYYVKEASDARYATTAQGAKADTAVQPSGLTKAAVGLGNADNTSDANKPISTATQTALNGKQAATERGQANGYAALGSDGKVPLAQLPPLGGGLPVRTVSGADTIIASDLGKLILCNGTTDFTLSLSVAAALTAKFFCDLRNDGAGVVIVDPNGSQTIDGLLSIRVYPGETFRISGDGTAFRTLYRKKGWVQVLQLMTSVAVVQQDVERGFTDPEFLDMRLAYRGVRPTGGNNNITLALKKGPSWAETLYSAAIVDFTGSQITPSLVAGLPPTIWPDAANTKPASAEIVFRNVRATVANEQKVVGRAEFEQDVNWREFSIRHDTDAAITGARIAMSGANIAIGAVFILSGFRL